MYGSWSTFRQLCDTYFIVSLAGSQKNQFPFVPSSVSFQTDVPWVHGSRLYFTVSIKMVLKFWSVRELDFQIDTCISWLVYLQIKSFFLCEGVCLLSDDKTRQVDL